MAEPRTSTAVLMTRGDGPGREVYLVERNPKLRFFGGYWSFPGGVLDADLDGEPDSADGDAALLRCALRELYEETGVLPSPLRAVLGAGGALRAELMGGGEGGEGGGGGAWRSGLERAPAAVEGLRPICRLTTPAFAPVRHRTLFLHLELPEGEQPEVVHGELIAGRFVRPGDALDAWRRGEHPIVPPALVLLELLRDARSLEEFLTLVGEVGREFESGRMHPARFTPGVQLAALRTPTVPPATTTNCLLVGEESTWIVDPATPEESERERLFDVLDRRVAEGRPPAGVLATHHHPDHVGSIVPTCLRYGIPVLGHPLTLARLPAGAPEARELVDGDEIDLGRAPDGSPDWRLRALHTPGHDRGHLAFVESRYGAAIVGDMLSTVSTIVIDPPEGHMRTYLASLRRLLDEPIGTVYPAHGPPAREGRELVRRFLAHRAQREGALVRALGTSPVGEPELVGRVYADVDEAVQDLAARSLAAGLEKLEEEGRAARAGDGWVRAGPED